MQKQRIPTLADGCVALLLVFGVAWAWPGGGAAGGPQAVVIRSAGGVVQRVSLAEPRTLTVRGPAGDTIIEIRDGAARFVSSPCPRQVCRRMGPARAPGDVIVCVPNRVMLTIEGPKHHRALDALSR